VVTVEKARDRPQEWAENAGDGRAGPCWRTCGRGHPQVLIVELSVERGGSEECFNGLIKELSLRRN
jgi:hypothetical protein